MEMKCRNAVIKPLAEYFKGEAHKRKTKSLWQIVFLLLLNTSESYHRIPCKICCKGSSPYEN